MPGFDIKLDRDLMAPTRVPDVGSGSIAQEYRRDAQAFYANLHQLRHWSNEFAACLALFEFCKEQNPRLPGLLTQWTFLAARNGGVAARNYGQCLHAARGVVGRVSIWKGKIDVAALKQIDLDFKKRFPDIDKLRHAVVHPEFYADPSINMGGGRRFVFQNALSGQTYLTVINGKTVKYDLSRDNALFLVDSTTRAYASVEQIARKPPDNPR